MDYPIYEIFIKDHNILLYFVLKKNIINHLKNCKCNIYKYVYI